MVVTAVFIVFSFTSFYEVRLPQLSRSYRRAFASLLPCAFLVLDPQAGEWRHAVSLIKSMRATGYPPTVLTLSSVISA